MNFEERNQSNHNTNRDEFAKWIEQKMCFVYNVNISTHVKRVHSFIMLQQSGIPLQS